MTCRELADFIGDYLSGELSAEVRAAFERHIRNCPNCARYLDGYKETVKLGKRALVDDEAVPDEVPDDLVRAILVARRASTDT